MDGNLRQLRTPRMHDPSSRTVCLVGDAAELAHDYRRLPDALDELAVRCDLIGAGPLLDEWARRRVKRQRARRRWYARNRRP